MSVETRWQSHTSLHLRFLVVINLRCDVSESHAMMQKCTCEVKETFSANNLVFASGQAGLDICLSFWYVVIIIGER